MKESSSPPGIRKKKKKGFNSRGFAERSSRGCSQAAVVVAVAAAGIVVVLASERAGQCEGQTGSHYPGEEHWSTGCTDFAVRAQGEVGEVVATSGVRW